MSRLGGHRPRGSIDPRIAWVTDIGDYVQALAWMPASTSGILAAASVSGPILIADRAGKPIRQIAGHDSGTNAVAWSPQGGHLASVGQDRMLALHQWDIPEAGIQVEIGPGSGEGVGWSPNRDLVAASIGRTLAIVRRDGVLLRQESDHPSTIAALAWAPDGHVVAVAHRAGLSLWSPDVAVPDRFQEWEGTPQSLAWSPDGTVLAAGYREGGLYIWMIPQDEPMLMRGYPSRVTALAWDPTSRWLLTNGGQDAVVWDCAGAGPAGRTPRMLRQGHRDLITAVAWSPLGMLVATGCAGGRVCLWDGTQQFVPVWAQEFAGYFRDEEQEPSVVAIAQLAWSPDGKRLAIGMSDGTVAVLNRL